MNQKTLIVKTKKIIYICNIMENFDKCVNIIGIILFALFLIYGCMKPDNTIEPFILNQ